MPRARQVPTAERWNHDANEKGRERESKLNEDQRNNDCRSLDGGGDCSTWIEVKKKRERESERNRRKKKREKAEEREMEKNRGTRPSHINGRTSTYIHSSLSVLSRSRNYALYRRCTKEHQFSHGTASPPSLSG